MKVQNFDINVSINDIILMGNKDGVGIQSLTISENVHVPLPICQLEFLGDDFFLDKAPLTDGVKIEISITNTDLNLKENYIFRLYNLEIQPNKTAIIYKVLGYFDTYEMFRDPYQFTARGHSSDIFSKVSSTYDYTTDIDVTNDEQLWVASELNLVKWLSNVASHGWIDETSCMMWALTRNKKLLYKDISNIIRKTNLNTIYNLAPMVQDSGNVEPSSKIITYKAALPMFNSGSENIGNGGYGGDNYYFDFEQYANQTIASKKAVASSKFVNVNKELSLGLSDTFYPFNVGNMHANYFLAKLQNSRISSLFSTYFNVVLANWYPLQLLDSINLNYSSDAQSTKVIKSLSGLYIVTGITTTITPQALSQSLMLSGQGYNTSSVTGTY